MLTSSIIKTQDKGIVNI